MFLRKITLFCLCFFMIVPTFYAVAQSKKKSKFYQIKVYHCKSNEQINLTEEFLKTDYLSALHQEGFKNVGVFKPLENDTSIDKRIIVFIPLQSIEQIISLEEVTATKTQLTAYTDAAYNNPPYQRIETIVLKAFKNMPQFAQPALTGNKEERIYELRSYEGATEKLYRKKVEMFNDGNEIGIFSRLNFNAVFYAEVLAGSKMPNLMYMTSFNSIKERDEHWKIFSADAEWKRLSGLPEYQHTVSKSDIILMHATDYSDIY